MFLWSYEKFKLRLELMADWYADLRDGGTLNRDHIFDPWLEISDEEIKQNAEDQNENTDNKIIKLREKLEEEKVKLGEIKLNKDNLLMKLEKFLSK